MDQRQRHRGGPAQTIPAGSALDVGENSSTCDRSPTQRPGRLSLPSHGPDDGQEARAPSSWSRTDRQAVGFVLPAWILPVTYPSKFRGFLWRRYPKTEGGGNTLGELLAKRPGNGPPDLRPYPSSPSGDWTLRPGAAPWRRAPHGLDQRGGRAHIERLGKSRAGKSDCSASPWPSTGRCNPVKCRRLPGIGHTLPREEERRTASPRRKKYLSANRYVRQWPDTYTFVPDGGHDTTL